MEENQKPGQRVITRVKRVVECHNCGNDNLVHGLHLAKVDNIMKVGGPGQIPTTVGDRWAVYLCMECNAIYPYPKQYPGNETLRKIYNQIFQWCDQKAKKRKSIDEAIEQLNSIISANKELLGLPGLSKDEAIEKTIAPLWEEIDNLK